MFGSAILLTTALLAQTSAPLVELSNPTATPFPTRPDFGTLEFDVTNRADQAVTGWMIRYSIQFSDGTSRNGGIGTDAILEYAGASKPGDSTGTRMAPARSTTRLRIGSLALTPKQGVTVERVTSITLDYAIFADESSIGDRWRAGLVILRRGQTADLIASMLPVLVEARSAGSTSDALKTALERLKAMDQPDLFSAEAHGARQNLQLFLEGRVHFNPDDFLRRAIEDARSRRAVYDAHRTPKSAPVSTVQVSAAGVGRFPDGFQFVDFDLTNLSDQAVVAWGIGFILHLSDGTTEQTGYGRDGLLVYEKILPPRRDPESEAIVPPHKTVRIRMAYPPPKQGVTVLSATSVGVTYAAFADDTWSGSQAEVESTYKRRTMELAAIARVLPVLRQALDGGMSVDDLRTALAQLAGKDQPDFESGARHVARTNIQLLLDGRVPQPAVFLQGCIDGLESSRSVYQSHSRPK